jgi:organic radical activating enzyme
MERFCSNPFRRLEIDHAGNARTCCHAWMPHSIGNVLKNSFFDVWNSETARRIRASIQDQTFAFCNRDICTPLVAGTVEREAVDEKYGEIRERRRTTLDRGPELFALNYDYTCNLFCRSCRPAPRRMDCAATGRLMEMQSRLVDSAFFSHARRLVITGAGEPFASEVFLHLLSTLRRERFPKIKITLRSNGNLLTPQNWERITNAHFAIDEISISIDAAEAKTYRHLRRGGDFRVLTENLSFLQKVKREKPFRLRFNFVVQSANFREMEKFVEMGKRFGCDRVTFSKLYKTRALTNREYRRAAIHLPGHPQHDALKHLLRSDLFADPVVYLGNLSSLQPRD